MMETGSQVYLNEDYVSSLEKYVKKTLADAHIDAGQITEDISMNRTELYSTPTYMRALWCSSKHDEAHLGRITIYINIYIRILFIMLFELSAVYLCIYLGCTSAQLCT